MLTAAHADLTKLCLKAQCFGPVLPILDIDMTKICTEEEHLDALHLLLYFYYGGCVYLAVKEYEKALYFFEVCVKNEILFGMKEIQWEIKYYQGFIELFYLFSNVIVNHYSFIVNCVLFSNSMK